MEKETKAGQEKMRNLTLEKEKLKTSLKINNEELNLCKTRIDSRNTIIDNMNIKRMQSDLHLKIIEKGCFDYQITSISF